MAQVVDLGYVVGPTGPKGDTGPVPVGTQSGQVLTWNNEQSQWVPELPSDTVEVTFHFSDANPDIVVMYTQNNKYVTHEQQTETSDITLTVDSMTPVVVSYSQEATYQSTSVGSGGTAVAEQSGLVTLVFWQNAQVELDFASLPPTPPKTYTATVVKGDYVAEVTVSPQRARPNSTVTVNVEVYEGYSSPRVHVSGDETRSEVPVTEVSNSEFTYTQPSENVTVRVYVREAPPPIS